MKTAPKKILIVRTDRIGDLVLSTPVISNLRAAFPQAHIAFMCSLHTKDILQGNPDLDEVIIYDKDSQHRGIFASVKFSLWLRKKKFDWALILHPTNRVHIMTFFAQIPLRIGWDKKKGWLLTQRLAHKKHEGVRHESEYTLDILRTLNIPIRHRVTYFPIQDQSEEKISKILHDRRLSAQRFIVVHPSASCPSKRWPASYFSDLVRLLKVRIKLPVVVVTSEQEKKYAEEIVKENDVVDLCGALTVSELGSLLKRAALFISNDSGPVHIASSLGVPVISIFGRNDPGLSVLRWKPLGENSISIHKDVGCRVCLAHNCKKGFLCLREIKPEEVYEEALRILKTATSSR